VIVIEAAHGHIDGTVIDDVGEVEQELLVEGDEFRSVVRLVKRCDLKDLIIETLIVDALGDVQSNVPVVEIVPVGVVAQCGRVVIVPANSGDQIHEEAMDLHEVGREGVHWMIGVVASRCQSR